MVPPPTIVGARLEGDLAGAVRVADGVYIEKLPDGDSVLLSVGSDRYFGLDEVGTRMWEALTSTATVDAAVQLVLSDYDIDEDQVRNDVDEFLASLVDRGLVRIVAE